MPERIVGDEEAAFADARRGDPEGARVVVLVDVAEDYVELALFLGEEFDGVADPDIDTVADSGTLKVATSFVGVLAVAVGVDNPTAFADGAGPPDGRIADGGAHL